MSIQSGPAGRKSRMSPFPFPSRGARRRLRWVFGRRKENGTDPTGPLALLAERRHALVRAEFLRTRRRRRTTVAALVLVQAAVLGAILILRGIGADGGAASAWAGALALATAGCWPLVLILGAANSAGWAVLAERTEETAFQLALTPVRARAIAAAKVLPYAPAWLCGLAAALPAYFLAGPFLAQGGPFGLCLAPWPLRMLAVPFALEHWRTDLSMPGIGAGLTMWLLDAMLVWAAAHWGATDAVRLGRPVAAAVHLLGRILFTGVMFVGFELAAIPAGCVVGVAVAGPLMLVVGNSEEGHTIELAFKGAATGTALLAFYLLTRLGVSVPASMDALKGFAHFDRLAIEEYRPETWGLAGADGCSEEPPTRL